MKTKRMVCPCIALFIYLLVAHSFAFAAMENKIPLIWLKHNPHSHAIISYVAWQDFLTHHVIRNPEGIHLIDYPNLNRRDLDTLKNHLAHMSTIDITGYNRHEQLAFWINLYNALTVLTVAEHYPISSIQDIHITPGLFSTGPWGRPLIRVRGVALSLNDIHQRIIRPIWNDPRTHYALNNATMGAANIGQQAFQGDKLDEQLNAAAIEYVNSLRGAHVIEGKLIVSKLYAWFIDDFGGNERGLIAHLLPFANPPLRRKLMQINTVNMYVYNWHLNSTAISL